VHSSSPWSGPGRRCPPSGGPAHGLAGRSSKGAARLFILRQPRAIHFGDNLGRDEAGADPCDPFVNHPDGGETLTPREGVTIPVSSHQPTVQNEKAPRRCAARASQMLECTSGFSASRSVIAAVACPGMEAVASVRWTLRAY
jgi:hypothetical protein